MKILSLDAHYRIAGFYFTDMSCYIVLCAAVYQFILEVTFFKVKMYFISRLLERIFSEAGEILKAVEENKRMWVRVNTKTQKMRRIGGSSLEIFEMDLEGDLPEVDHPS